MKGLGKERIVLFTQFFLTHDEPITVKQLQQMVERYNGEKVKRQTIYDDLNAIDIVIGLKCEHVPDQVGRTLQWSRGGVPKVNQIILPFDFGEQICVSLPDGKMIITKVVSYKVYYDAIKVNTINGTFDSSLCFKASDYR